MQEKQRCTIFFYHFLCRLVSRFYKNISLNIYCEKNTAIIRWPPRRVTAALQVVKTWFLRPRPHLFPLAPAPRDDDKFPLNLTTNTQDLD